MKRLSSAATGHLDGTRKQSAPDGPRHGERTSEAGQPGSALTAATAQAARRLASMAPHQADGRLQSRLQRFGFSISIKTESRFPKAGGMRTVPVAAIVTPNHPAMEFTGSSADERATLAIADVRQFLTPPTSEQIIGWLGELDALTARKEGDEANAQVTIAAYGQRLSVYPADVVRQVMQAWPSSSKWWPTWSDLEPDLERLTKPRRLMLHALEQPREHDGELVTTPALTPEQRRAVISEVNDMIGPMREDKRHV